MNRMPMDLMEADRTDEDDAAKVADCLDTSLEELIRRARLQVGEMSLMIQRLERLRRDMRRHLSDW
jgi:hypothetical protein